jgi:hypothetical protein
MSSITINLGSVIACGALFMFVVTVVGCIMDYEQRIERLEYQVNTLDKAICKLVEHLDSKRQQQHNRNNHKKNKNNYKAERAAKYAQ